MRFSSNKYRLLIAASCVVVPAAIAAIIVYAQSDPLRSPARRTWRDEAVRMIQARVSDKDWLARERASLSSKAATRPYSGGWVSDELLVMKNGDWIACESVCAKEQATPVKKDLFIGFGSDGRWYYSTFHFCVGKCVLEMERQPDTLAEFVDGFCLAPFDGKSDDSLKVTWNGGAYGDEKLELEHNAPH